MHSFQKTFSRPTPAPPIEPGQAVDPAKYALTKTVRTGGTGSDCPLRCAPPPSPFGYFAGMLRERYFATPLATAARFQKWRENGMSFAGPAAAAEPIPPAR